MKLPLAARVTSLLPSDERITVIDGGARDALADPRWTALPRVRVYGFDPDKTEVARLNQAAAERGLDFHYFAAGLSGASGRSTFYDNNIPGGGSLLEQNRAVTDRWRWPFGRARDIFFPARTHEIDVITLDDWAARSQIADIDFLKLNVQGAELAVLGAGSRVVPAAVGIYVEVSFVESYKRRPLFADVDPFLRNLGFTFFDLCVPHHVGRAESPIIRRDGRPSGQLIEGHALYLRDPVAGGGQPTSKILKLICLAECFQQVEFAIELLHWLKATRPGDLDEGDVDTLAAAALGEYRASNAAGANSAA